MQRPPTAPWLLALLAVAGCAASAPDPSMQARARERLMVGDSCPDKQIVHEDPKQMTFVLSGCDAMMKFKVACDASECVPTRLSATRFQQPQRLRTTDKKVWVDASPQPATAPGGLTPAADPGGEPVTVKTGKRLSDISRPPHRPTLPREMNVAGMVVWGLYKVCVNSAGQVNRVEVIQSALPGGLDGDWIARIETWQYEPYQVSGRAVPFCHPARLEVRAQS